MVQSTNVVSRYDATRVVREDLSDVIEMISQEDTPYTSNIGRGKAEQTYSEWNTDSLMAANEDNAAIEGDDATTVATTPPVTYPGLALDARPATSRMGDYTQIMRKIAGVTGTLQAINVVGGKKQLAREMMKAGREIKLDREKRLVGIKPAVPGSDTVPREMAGFGAWIRTNVSRGSGGTNPTLSGTTEGYPLAGPGPGTQRAFTETLLKGVMQSAYTEGGKPKLLMVPPAQKVVASTFPGIAPSRVNIEGIQPAKIIGTADVYLSDFGQLAIVPNPQMRARDAWLVDPEQAELLTLRPVESIELARTGDSVKKMIVWEGTHKINNEKAHGAIADLT